MTTTTPADPLSPPPGNPPPAPKRVYYSLGRMLGVTDFQADQDYHRGRLARALLQLCGTGTVAGLSVSVTTPAATGSTAGSVAPAPEVPFAGGWRPNTPFPAPCAIADSNNNLQVLNVTSAFTSGATVPLWSTAIGGTTSDGATAAAWKCSGPPQLEILVTPGMAIDRVGRMIEAPRAVCIRIQPWLANHSAADLGSAIHSGNLLVDVFATFYPCTSGVTPAFAATDDYDATDAFSPDRLLDSFAMQLVLRSDPTPQLPKDPWLPAGAAPTAAINATITQALKQTILEATAGPAAGAPFSATGARGAEYPPGFDPSAVFLARVSIPATAGASGQPPTFNLNTISIDNLSRLFLYPPSLVARSIGLSSGLES